MKKPSLIHKLYIYLIKLIKNKQNRTPNYIALTVSIGVIIGLFPIIGQSYLCILAWTILRIFKIHFNLLASCAITFISNPITTPFLFYTFYLTGQFMLGENMIPFSVFIEQINIIFTDEFSFKIVMKTISDLLQGLAKPMLLGYIPWGIAGGIFGYFIGYRASVKWQQRRKRKHISSKILS